MARHLPLYMQLAPEHGGTRFGPFTTRFDVGSDPNLCQLVLPSNLGVYPSHAIVVQNAPGVVSVQPTGQGCQIFLIPHGQTQSWPVGSPVQVNNGDQLIFGTPTAPRFTLLIDHSVTQSADKVVADARAMGAEAGAVHAVNRFLDGMFGPPRGSGIGAEVQRQAQARMLRKSPYREIYAVWTRMRSGAFTSPRALVSIAIALMGLVATGSLTCSGVFYAIYRAVMW